jgi:hypothetical protein
VEKYFEMSLLNPKIANVLPPCLVQCVSTIETHPPMWVVQAKVTYISHASVKLIIQNPIPKLD